jgi:glycosyltransferase involved in cell wall biosynthesis
VSDLVVSPFTPVLGSGQALRTYAIVRALAADGPVDLLYAQFGAEDPAPEYERIAGLSLHPVQPSRGPRRLAAYAAARLRGTPDGFARGASPELADAAAALSAGAERGRIVADGPVAAAALLPLARRRPAIYNAHNLESAFRAGIERGGESAARRMRRFEETVLEAYAETWMVSPADVAGALQLRPDARVRYVPNVVDVAAIDPVPPRSAPGSRVLFVGDFTYAPNREGFRFLAGEVMPRLWERRADARLAVAGRGLEPDAGLDDRIDLLGFVADLPAAYAAADCVAVPLLQGGGSPLKFVEAMAYGQPVVATPLAARGLEAEAGRDFLEAAGAEGFAAALDRALAGDAAAAGRSGRSLVERDYSIESLTRRLTA